MSFMIRYLFVMVGVVYAGLAFAQPASSFHLIAHRGGVVDSVTAENSMASLEKAHARGYWMVEIDMRATRDGHLVTNHDASLKKYYGVDKKVSDMDWKEIAALKGSNGNRVLELENIFAYCSGKMQVMLDNKIKGMDTALFNSLLQLLKKYHLDKEAFMIGTDESTEFFTGKIRLSCTRKQLEDNMNRSDYSPAHYYLFTSDLTREDVQWAKQKNISAVGVINAWTFHGSNPQEQARQAAEKLIATGADYFQIDSGYEQFFTHGR